MDRSDIRIRLEKLPSYTLRDIELTWVEVILDRMQGNRRTTCEYLGISMSKMRRYITNKKVFAKKLQPQGRPRI